MYLNKKTGHRQKISWAQTEDNFQNTSEVKDWAHHSNNNGDCLLLLLYHPSVFIKYSQTVCNFTWIPNIYEYVD